MSATRRRITIVTNTTYPIVDGWVGSAIIVSLHRCAQYITIRIVMYWAHLCSDTIIALPTQPSTIGYVVFVTIVIRLLVALIQLTWLVVRLARRLRRWRRRRVRV